MSLTEDQKQKYLEKGVTHILHVTDTYDWDDYTVEVKEDELYEDKREEYSRNMQRVTRVDVVVDPQEYEQSYDERLAKLTQKRINELLKLRANPEQLKGKIYRMGEKEMREMIFRLIASSASTPKETMTFVKGKELTADAVITLVYQDVKQNAEFSKRTKAGTTITYQTDVEIAFDRFSPSTQDNILAWNEELGEKPERYFVRMSLEIHEHNHRCELSLLEYGYEYVVDHIPSEYTLSIEAEPELTQQYVSTFQEKLQGYGFKSIVSI